MTNERKASLIVAISAAHPAVTVRGAWSMCDFDYRGIQLKASHAATGNTLCDDRSEDELDAMTDAEVIAWAAGVCKKFIGRQKQTRRLMAVEREMDQE